MTDDKTLAIRCRDGDNAAREELYRRYSPRLLSLCLRYCQDRPQAEDTMHDAFVRILESIGKYRYTSEGSLYSWMARVTVNLCFDSLRKRRRVKESLVGDFSTADFASLSETSIQTQSLEPGKLKKMVEELPLGYRTVLMLYAVEDLSHKEIGKLLHIKEKSSASNLARARAMLSEKIKSYYEND